MRLGPDDEVADDHEVAREAHLHDRLDLELQPLRVLRAAALAFGGIREQLPQPLLQALARLQPEVVVQRHPRAVDLRGREVRQVRLAQRQAQVAAPRDLHGVGQRRGQVGEQLAHLRLRLEVLFPREAAHPLRVAQQLALGDADPGLVRLEVLGLEELHRVRGHHRQSAGRRQPHGGAHVGLVRGAAGALQLQVEAAREQLGEVRGDRGCAPLVARQQRLPDGAGVGAGQRDQAVGVCGQHRPAHPGLRALRVVRPRLRQDLAQVVVAAQVLHQHQQPRRLLVAELGQRLHHQVAAEDRLDPLAAAGLVELDGAEQVVQVRDRQRALRVRPRGRGGIVDAKRAVDDGELGVRAQVDEGHARSVGPGRAVHYRRGPLPGRRPPRAGLGSRHESLRRGPPDPGSVVPALAVPLGSRPGGLMDNRSTSCRWAWPDPPGNRP